jgi:hypothetical protein
MSLAQQPTVHPENFGSKKSDGSAAMAAMSHADITMGLPSPLPLSLASVLARAN